MKLRIQKITSKEYQTFYESFQGDKTFLQTIPYGDLRHLLNEKTTRYGIFDYQTLIGVFQYQQVNARRGSYLFCPHGPLLQADTQHEALQYFLQYFIDLGTTARVDFVRVSSLLPPSTVSAFKAQKYIAAVPYMQTPQRTIVLDLTKTDEELMAEMKKSMRYEIRRIAKAGISVQIGRDEIELQKFWNLHTQTVDRKQFRPFPLSLTRKELAAFGNDAQIFTAKIDDVDQASSLILFDCHAGYYHQGSSKPHKLPVAHATLWAAIQYARGRGCTQFNLWGVCEAENKKHPWTGLSRFKRAFGGTEKTYLHAQDYGITWRYQITRMIEHIERWKKGY